MKNKKIIIIAIIISVLIILAVGIFAFIKNKNTSTSSDELKKSEETRGTENLTPVDMNNLENAKIVEDEKVNTSKEILKDREIEGLKITNISLKTDEGASLITADVQNDSKKDFKGGMLVFKFINNGDVQFAILEASVQPIKAGEKSEIAAKTTADLVNAKDFTLQLIEE